MGRVSEIITGENVIATIKCSDAVTDNDVNKPLTIDESDTVKLAVEGDEIYGFIDSIDPTSEDGAAVIGAMVSGRKWVIMEGTYDAGDIVEAADNTTAGVAMVGDWSVCKKHTLATDSVANLAASIFSRNWKVIYGDGTDGSEALIELA